MCGDVGTSSGELFVMGLLWVAFSGGHFAMSLAWWTVHTHCILHKAMMLQVCFESFVFIANADGLIWALLNMVNWCVAFSLSKVTRSSSMIHCQTGCSHDGRPKLR